MHGCRPGISVFLLLVVEQLSTSNAFILRGQRQKRFVPIQLPANYNPYGDINSVKRNPFESLLPLNPFTHNFGFGTDYQGANPVFNGDLHLTVIDNPNKIMYPFELGGSLRAGTTNVQLTFGESANPVNPLDVPIEQTYPCLVGLCNSVNNLLG